MKKIIAFNWKMNPATYSEAEIILKDSIELKENSKESTVIVFPPFVWLTDLSHKNSETLLFGAQDVFWEKGKGAYTGEISAEMLLNSKVEYALAGHSERRRVIGESDEVVNKKLLAGLSAGLKMILCVGEDLEIRKMGEEKLKDFIKGQLLKGLENVKGDLVIAYEPIWAIGTGIPATPEDAVKVIEFIKQTVEGYGLAGVKVLYGGSVDSKNIEVFLSNEIIDGVLVGGASLNPKQFKGLV